MIRCKPDYNYKNLTPYSCASHPVRLQNNHAHHTQPVQLQNNHEIFSYYFKPKTKTATTWYKNVYF